MNTVYILHCMLSDLYCCSSVKMATLMLLLSLYFLLRVLLQVATFFVMSGKTFCILLDYLQYCLMHLHYLVFLDIQFLIFQKVDLLFFHI